MGKIQESSRIFRLPLGVDRRTVFGIEEISLSPRESIICQTIQSLGQKQFVTPVCVARRYIGTEGSREIYDGRPCRRNDLIVFAENVKGRGFGEINFTSYQKTMLRGYFW